jgi:phage terminase small subunit
VNENAMKQHPLRPRHRKFVELYVIDLNGTQAAIGAGYRASSARWRAATLLRRPEVAAAVEAALAPRREKARITGDRVLAEYGHIAFADIRNFAEWGPEGVTLRDMKDLSAADAAAIADIQPSNGNGKGARIKLYDKKAALDALARHLGLFDPRTGRGKEDKTVNGRDARAVLRERIMKLMRKGNGS